MSCKRRRILLSCNVMESETAKAKLAAVAEKLGREIRVFKISPDSAASVEAPTTSASQDDPPDDFYDLTPDDYYRMVGNKIGSAAQFLKTRKIREAEAAARRAKINKVTIRVRFPDSYVIEAKFNPSETIENLSDLLSKVVARPDLPFYIYTVPPKERVKDMSKDFYSAGLIPGANVYFAYDLPKDGDAQVLNSSPFLHDEIISLSAFDDITESSENSESVSEVTTETVEPPPEAPAPEPKPATKPGKPRWFKM